MNNGIWRRRNGIVLAGALSTTTAIACGGALDVGVVPLVKSGDQIPLGPGAFKSLSAPAIDGGFIAFEGTSTTDPTYRSIFRSNTLTLARIADTFTAMPGGSGQIFSWFGFPPGIGALTVDGVFVTFVGRDSTSSAPGPLEGIYTGLSPAPARVFDSAPRGNGNYANFGVPGEPSRNGNRVVCAVDGVGGLPDAIIMRDLVLGTTTTIVSLGTDLPGAAGAATSLAGPVIAGDRVVFWGAGPGPSGVVLGAYLLDLTSNALSLVADTTMAAPGGTGNFFSISSLPSLDDDGNVVFHGQSPGRNGVYLKPFGGAAVRVADTTTPVPGGGGVIFNFIPFGSASVDKGVVAFGASAGVLGSGVYRYENGHFDKLLRKGELIGLDVVSGVFTSRQAIDGASVAVRVTFNSGGEAIVLLVVNPPQAADLDGDGVVGPIDLGAVLGDWGACPAGGACTADLDGDGTVGPSDLALLLGGWSGPPANDEVDGALSIGIGSTPISTVFATDSVGELVNQIVDCDEGGGGTFERDLWYRVQACDDGFMDHKFLMTATTCGTVDFDSRIAIYRDDPTVGVLLVSCSDDALGCDEGSTANWIANAGDTFFIRVGGGPTGPASGSGTMLVTCMPLDLGSADAVGEDPSNPLLLTSGAALGATAFVYFPPDADFGASPYDAAACADPYASDAWVMFVGRRTGVVRVLTCSNVFFGPVSTTFYRDFMWDIPIACDAPDFECSSSTPLPSKLEFVGRPGGLYYVRMGLADSAPPPGYFVRVNQTGERCAARNCFAEHELIGCETSACCDVVCALDSYCCSVRWDAACAGTAVNLCRPPTPTCGASSELGCYEPHSSPGCADADCCAAVCAIDFVCCDIAWDINCATQAVVTCDAPPCGELTGESCFEAHLAPGCNDETCCGIICSIDSLCCSSSWDLDCSLTANQICPR